MVDQVMSFEGSESVRKSVVGGRVVVVVVVVVVVRWMSVGASGGAVGKTLSADGWTSSDVSASV
jgi:hypothetical protein